ncbi:MAG: peptidyl-alpha-hydroxyglycine alpha-amidating lyase family protein [Candidatus Poribacteria bacterium]|nr:peptidyl-alpha-hydroxyglycine alpha-amidating lyase family protein [Candidatus Poribacteria bacterium]
MVSLGSGSFTYEVSGKNWGNMPEDWTYKEATAVAVDSKDNVYVFNRGTHPMIVFDPGGNVVRTWGDGIFTNPHGVTIGPDDSVYCVDNFDHTVRKFTPDGKLLMTLGAENQHSPAMSGIPFNEPTHLAVDSQTGDLYVADGYANARVHKFSPDGRLLFSWGESGTDPGQFNIVHNIVTDKEGWVYVADRENHRIQVFDSNGKYEAQWVNLSRAACIHVDHRSDQLVYVGEYYGGIQTNVAGKRLGPRVSVLDLKGNVLARVGDLSYGDEPGRFYSPHGIAADSKGDIYVAEVSWSDYGSRMDPPRELRSLQKLVRQS